MTLLTRSSFAYGLAVAAALGASVLALVEGSAIEVVATTATIGVASLVAWRGHTIGALVSMAAAGAGLTAALADPWPWWSVATCGLAGLAFTVAFARLVRRDAVAAVGAAVVFGGLGAGAGLGVGALRDASRRMEPTSWQKGVEQDTVIFGEGFGDAASTRAGKDEALRDLAAGTPRFLTYGYPSPAIEDFAALLEERYGVRLEAIAGCTISARIVGRADGYDAEIERHLEARFGKRVIERTWDDAEARYRLLREGREQAAREAQALIEEMLLDSSRFEGAPTFRSLPDSQ